MRLQRVIDELCKIRDENPEAEIDVEVHTSFGHTDSDLRFELIDRSEPCGCPKCPVDRHPVFDLIIESTTEDDR